MSKKLQIADARDLHLGIFAEALGFFAETNKLQISDVSKYRFERTYLKIKGGFGLRKTTYRGCIAVYVCSSIHLRTVLSPAPSVNTAISRRIGGALVCGSPLENTTLKHC